MPTLMFFRSLLAFNQYAQSFLFAPESQSLQNTRFNQPCEFLPYRVIFRSYQAETRVITEAGMLSGGCLKRLGRVNLGNGKFVLFSVN
jgi:hypothetical protein